MKKTLILLSSVALLSAVFVTGCKKEEDDTLGPAITLNGSNPMYILEDDLDTDPGAQATDDVDGTVIYTSDWSILNPDINNADTYTITYSAKDAAGNTSSKTRTVHVVNLNGTYLNAHDTCAAGNAADFDALVTDSTDRYFTINNFGANGNTVNILCKLNSNGTIGAPAGNQSLGGAAILKSILSPGSGMITPKNPIKFTIKYLWNDGVQDEVCISTYTK